MSFIQSYLRKKQDSSSLAIFRLGFGILMTISIIRFWQKGWIETLYLDPSFHFSFYGFEWVKPIGEYTYLIFLICATSAFLVAIGYKYYLSIIVFFLSLYFDVFWSFGGGVGARRRGLRCALWSRSPICTFLDYLLVIFYSTGKPDF